MTMRDAISNWKTIGRLGPAVYTTDQTLVADLQGYTRVGLLLTRGIGGITFDPTNKIEFKLEESDDNVSYTAVNQYHLLPTTGIVITAAGVITTWSLVAAHAAATEVKLGYIGDKRYIRLTADFSGTHGTGTPLLAQFFTTDTNQKPAV